MNNRRQLSPKQDQILKTLVLMTHENKRQPSYRELAKEAKVSSVYKYLLELEVKGWIKITGESRGISIPQDVFDEIVDTRKTEAPSND